MNTAAGGAVTGARNGVATVATTGATTITTGSVTGPAGSGLSTSATTGATTITINGTVKGLGGATTAAVNVASAGGAIIVNNNAGGVIQSIGGSVSDLAIGATTAGTGSVTINNAGSINGMMNLSGASRSTLNNSGTISLVDNETNDVLNAGSTAFVSSGAANIALDVFLGAGVQNSCAAPAIADCVVLGATSGTGTTITLNDTNAAGGAVLNANAIVLVHTASSNAADFTLAGPNVVNTPQGAMLQKGFIEYQLAFDAPNSNFVLVTAPSVAALEMGSLMAGMQNLWHMTTEASDDRLATLRQNYAAARNGDAPIPAAGDSANGTSVWGKLSYGEFRRDNSLTLNGPVGSLSYDTSYKQTMEGIEAGIDHITDIAGGAWVLGALAGYETSPLHFRNDDDRVRYVTWDFGAYASYVSGPWFGDLLVKDDLARAKFDFAAVPGLANRDGNSIGAKLTLGGRFAEKSLILEPTASLAYVRSTLSTSWCRVPALTSIRAAASVGRSACAWPRIWIRA